MTLEDLGNLEDFIGGLLVAISLIYLAMQVRQNTKSLRAARHLEENKLLTRRITEGYDNELKAMFQQPSMLEWLPRHKRTIDSDTTMT